MEASKFVRLVHVYGDLPVLPTHPPASVRSAGMFFGLNQVEPCPRNPIPSPPLAPGVNFSALATLNLGGRRVVGKREREGLWGGCGLGLWLSVFHFIFWKKPRRDVARPPHWATLARATPLPGAGCGQPCAGTWAP